MFHIASEQTYQDGEIIIEEGTAGDSVYVVHSGTVEISKTIGGRKFIMTVLGPGEVFGELAFLGGIARTTTARAVGETSIGVIDRASLDEEFGKLSSESREIFGAVAKRFKKMLDRTVEFSSRKEIRAQKTLSLSYKDRKSLVDSYAQNIGDGGLFIETENPLEKGKQFLLRLELPGLSDPVEIMCEVVWVRKQQEVTDHPNGMGVKFLEITKADDETLKQYFNL